MLQRFEVNGVHLNVDKDLAKHLNKKIGGLDKYIPRGSRNSAHVEVYLKEVKAKDNNRFVCEVNMQLPHKSIMVKERAQTMYAAVDVAETKLKLQLKKYKDQSADGKNRRHLVGRLLRRGGSNR